MNRNNYDEYDNYNQHDDYDEYTEYETYEETPLEVEYEEQDEPIVVPKRAKYNARIDRFLTNGIIIVAILLIGVLLIAFIA